MDISRMYEKTEGTAAARKERRFGKLGKGTVELRQCRRGKGVGGAQP